jgi:hypothetical protein
MEAMMTPHAARSAVDLDGDRSEETAVPERQYPASPEGAARIDAWLAALTPEERAILDEASRLDRLDDTNHR